MSHITDVKTAKKCPICHSDLIKTEFKTYDYYKCTKCSVKITEPKEVTNV